MIHLDNTKGLQNNLLFNWVFNGHYIQTLLLPVNLIPRPGQFIFCNFIYIQHFISIVYFLKPGEPKLF